MCVEKSCHRTAKKNLQNTDYTIPTPSNEAMFDTANINHEIVHTYVDISERDYSVTLFEVNGDVCDISSPILPGDGISIYSQAMDCEPGCNYDGSTTNLKVYLNVEQETVFTNHNIWSMNDDGTVATLQYCIRVDLYADMDNDGTITKDYRSYESVSFLEVKNTVTLNMAVGVNVDESIQPFVNDQDLLLFSVGGSGTDYTLRTMWIAARDMPCTFDSTAATTTTNYGESSDQKMALLCITTNAPSNLIRIKDIVNLSLQQGDTTITTTTGPNDNMVIVDNGSTSVSDGGEGSSGIVVHFEALDPILFQLLASSSTTTTTTTTNDERMEVTVKGTVIIDLYNDDEKMEQQLVGNNLRGSGTQEQQLLQQQQQLSSSLTESEQTFEAPKLVLQRSPNSSSSSSSASSSPSSSRYAMWWWITVVASIATFIVF